jgi:hypothetical protein
MKSIRGPSEAESLRANPFKYYNADQIHLAISSRPASLTTPARREPVAAKPSAPKSSTTLKAKKSAPRAESDKRERVASPVSRHESDQSSLIRFASWPKYIRKMRLGEKSSPLRRSVL